MSARWGSVTVRRKHLYNVVQDYLAGEPLKDLEAIEIKWPDGTFSEHRVFVTETETSAVLIEEAHINFPLHGEHILIPLKTLTKAKVRRVANAS